MYEKYTKELIYKNMLEEIPVIYDKGIGSVISDLVMANSYIMEKFYKDLELEINNSFVTLADSGESEEAPNLERIAFEKTFLLREEAKKSSGLLKITSNNPLVLPVGTVFIRKDGLKYYSIEEITLNQNDIKYVFIECSEVGEIGNCPVGYINKMENEIEGTLITNDKPFVNGEDKEKKEIFRQRILQNIYKPASSGNKYHYLKWLSEYQENGIKMLGKNKVIPRFDGLPYTIKIIITDSNNQPAEENLVIKIKDYIEQLRPEGALITYESAIRKDVSVYVKASLNQGIMTDTAYEKTQNSINKYFYNISLEENDNDVRVNGIAGILMCTNIFKNISEIKLNDDILDIIISDNEVPVLINFVLEVI